MIVTTEDGKYVTTVTGDGRISVARNGVANWRNETGDGYIFSLLTRIDELQSAFDELAGAVGWSKERCEQSGDSPLDCALGLVNSANDWHGNERLPRVAIRLELKAQGFKVEGESPEAEENNGWDGFDISKATHYHVRYRSFLWLEDGMSSARCWHQGLGWSKSYWYDIENFLPRAEWTDAIRNEHESRLKDLSK